MEEQLIYLHAIRSLPSISDKALRKILEAFDHNPKTAWDSSILPDGLRLGTVFKNVWTDRHTLIPDPEASAKILLDQNIRIIIETESAYPPLLKEIPDRPYFLYIRGTLPSPHIPLLAVVGSRKFSSYGQQACESLVRDLSRAGVGIVSGLAFGIDKIAHLTALKESAYTLAVLGSGVDDDGITPHTHLLLGQEIVKTGALISEFPPYSPASPKNFPLRNRIVAGMTLGTLVIEAAEKSGSLITARLALEYNREVFTVPGSIFSSLAVGTNALLKKGAIPVTHAQDILQILQPFLAAIRQETPQKKVVAQNLSPLENHVLKLLSYESLHIDELAKQINSSIAEVSSVLMMLEIKKYIKHIGNQHYILASP